MTDQVQYWIQIATYDLETAEAMLDSNRFLYVGFMCHQAIEKLLKGLYVAKNNSVPPRVHNLARLLKLVKLDSDIPNDLLDILNTLNPLNIATRYPDQDFEILKDLDQEYATEMLTDTRRLFEWLKTKM